MKNFLKNKMLFLIIIGVILLGIFLVYYFATKEDINNDTKNPSNLVYINLNDLKNKINNQESFMLVVIQTGCPHCEQYIPILNEALNNYDFKANVINLSELKDDLAEFKSLINISGTPTSIFFKNGVETTSLNRLVGSASQSTIIERLKSLGYIA